MLGVSGFEARQKISKLVSKKRESYAASSEQANCGWYMVSSRDLYNLSYIVLTSMGAYI